MGEAVGVVACVDVDMPGLGGCADVGSDDKGPDDGLTIELLLLLPASLLEQSVAALLLI